MKAAGYHGEPSGAVLQDVHFLRGHVTLDQQETLLSGLRTLGHVGDEHGMTREAAFYEHVADLDVGERRRLQLVLQRVRARVGKHEVHVFAEGGVIRLVARGERAALAVGIVEGDRLRTATRREGA